MIDETEEAPLTQEVTTETPAPAPEAAEGETTPQTAAPPAQVSREMEDKARDMGWVPQNEWRGSPDVWRPADQFVKRGEEVLPIIRSNLERERRKNHDLEAKMTDLPKQIEQQYADRFKRLEGMTRIALDKQRESMWGQFEAKKREAVEAGDTQGYDRLNTEQRKALAEFHADTEAEEPARAEPAKPTTQSQAPPEVQAWVEENRWFNGDPVLTAFATKEHGRLLKTMPGLSIEENLRRTLDATKQKFPEEFGLTASNGHGTPAQPHAPSVEGGGRQVVGAGREKGWNDLPPEAKDAGKIFIIEDHGFGYAEHKDLVRAQKAFAKSYWEQF